MSDANDIKIAVLQTQMANVEHKVDTLDKKVDDGFAVLNQKFDDFFTKAESKFAPSWTADALKWLIISIIAAVVAAIMRVVLLP